jgi:death-on-curing protein
MRYLSISDILEIHDRIISSSGGHRGIRNLNALESAISQPRKHLIKKTFILI